MPDCNDSIFSPKNSMLVYHAIMDDLDIILYINSDESQNSIILRNVVKYIWNQTDYWIKKINT